MTANPELTPQQRLEEMVREKMGGVSRSHLTTFFKLAVAFGHVALDLLQERDALKDKLAAAEAQVKALTAERDERIKQLHLLLCEVQVNWPCTVYNNLLWGDILRRIDAALKGESHD